MALENLRILRLEAENIKRIVAVDISPQGDVIEITGKNRQGKTSVLDSILWALGGEKPIQWKPIRDGEEKAHIALALGNDDGLKLKVTRRFTAQEGGTFTTSLVVENEDGMRPSGAQTLLNAIVGSLAFDPGEFIRASPKEQVSILKTMIPGVDFDAIAAKRKLAFEERTDVNREVARLSATLKAFPDLGDVPDEPVSIDDLSLELASISDHNVSREQHLQARREMRTAADRHFTSRDNHRALAEELRAQAEQADLNANRDNARGVEIENEIVALPPIEDPKDPEDVRVKIRAAVEANEKVEAKRARARVSAQVDLKKAQAEALTKKLADLDADVERAVADAKLPVSGLSLTLEGVQLRGVPFEQASDAEQLRASMALAIASNPKLRVIRVRDGSLLDDEAMAVIREVAAGENFQIWIETVHASDSDAIVMEAGRVKE